MLPTHRISHFLGAVALGLSAAFVLPPAHADERPGKKLGGRSCIDVLHGKA